MPRLTEMDSKILQNLLMDGRITYDELAKKCGTSENQVWKRCKRMEKKGFIKGATVQVNFGHFGYDALATLLINVNAQQIERAMELIKEVTEVRAYRQYNSVYNVRATAILRDLAELDHVKELLRRKLPMLGLKTYLWTGVRNIPENLDFIGTSSGYNGGNKHNLDKAICRPSGKITIDEIDMQMIEKLAFDGRMAFTQIAKESGLSVNTITKRYRRLVENGTIKVSIQIDANKLGYATIMDCNVAFTSQPMAKNIVDSFAKISDLIIITKTSGDYDLQLTAMVRDIKQLFSLQDQIARISGVTQIESSTRKIPEKWPTPKQYISVL